MDVVVTIMLAMSGAGAYDSVWHAPTFVTSTTAVVYPQTNRLLFVYLLKLPVPSVLEIVLLHLVKPWAKRHANQFMGLKP